jgi:hypothetical protein
MLALLLAGPIWQNFKILPEKDSNENEHDSPDAALEFARRAEDQRGIANNPTIDESERTSKVRFHLFLENSNAFLGYTIERGLVQYVNGKLSQQPQLLPSERGALLHRALGNQLLICRWDISLVSMVRMLLKRGFSLNDSFRLGKFTVWHQFFQSYPAATAETKEQECWRSILQIFLLSAANIHEAFRLFSLMMTRNEMFDSTENSPEYFIYTVELLLSHAMDPNQSDPSGRTIWTSFLEDICTMTTSWL